MEANESPQLPQAVIEYIDEVIKRMGYRRKVRQDVRQELTDHFTDALDHLSTEEAKLAAANDLIAQFGDAAILGKMMRRAKKRCRPLWLKFIIRSLQIIGALILLVILYSVWFLSGRPIITTDYVAQFNEYGRVPEKVDDTQNAAQSYFKAAESYVDLSDITDIKNFNIRKKRYSTISKEDEAVVREWITRNDQAISLWVEGSFKPYLWQEYASDTGEVVGILIQYLSQWRDINRVILWKAYLDAEDGNFKSAFENLLVSYRTASHIKSQKTITEQLVALACIRLSDEALLHILNDFNIPQEELGYLKNELAEIEGSIDFTLDFEGEKYFAFDEIQRSIVTTPLGNHLYLKRVNSSPYEFMYNEFNSGSGSLKVLFTFPDKEQALSSIDSFYDKMKEYSKIRLIRIMRRWG